MNPYQKLLSKKRSWEPVMPTKGDLVEGSEEAIFRALALRNLEVPVGDFITNALNTEVPDTARELLLSNVQDEIKHDIALGNIAIAHGTDEKAEREAESLRKAWVEHHDHTILKAMVAERSLFFVLLPFFRANGDAGMRSASADISLDERGHVATNSLVCRELGLKPSKSLDALRKATISWVMAPLKAGNPNKYLDKDFWLKSSDRLMYEGKAPELAFTQSSRMLAFFEHSNVNLPQYA